MRRLSLTVASLTFALGFVAGCGDSGPKRYKVTGSVKYKGVPIPAGAVTFLPEEAGGATMGGAAIKDGQFEIAQANGLVAGKYKVAIVYPDPKGPQPKEGDPPGESRESKELLPANYNRDTVLRAEVKPDGPNDFPFDLK